jgi:basic membrane lipoprotein Med (substrate-binding protein (PBP1-ABC) superfamily)
MSERARRVLRLRIALFAGAIACAVAAGVLAVSHHSGENGSAARARQYSAFDACLLTGSQGLAEPQAAQAWAGMQDASLETHAKVEYLQAMGPQTSAAALPYLASLVQRDCNLIIAVGTDTVSAVSSQAGRYPQVRFAVVGGQQAGNVTAVTAASGQIRPAVSQIVTSAVQASGTA